MVLLWEIYHSKTIAKTIVFITFYRLDNFIFPDWKLQLKLTPRPLSKSLQYHTITIVIP